MHEEIYVSQLMIGEIIAAVYHTHKNRTLTHRTKK
jgi:proteasome lid subunit RPN8/RPN11